MPLGSVLSTLLPLAEREPSYWLPPAATAEAAGIDQTFDVIMWINYLYGIPIFLIVLYFVIRYRRRDGVEPDPSPHHSFLLEVTWTVIPTIMVVGIFFQGFLGYIRNTTMPGDPYEIAVRAYKWQWEFTYPNGAQTAELHVPAGRDVLLTMESSDVMHSLYIPAFRVKRDIIPGRYTKLWFNALDPTGPEPDRYPLFCTEYCGDQHWAMGGDDRVWVHNPSSFDVWVKDAADPGGKLPPDQYGELLWKQKCISCHSIDGKAGTGPSWKGIYGEEHAYTAGGAEGVAPVDENYIRESILYPNAKIVKGYRGVMPAFEGKLDEMQITGLIEFIKRISDPEGYQPLPSPDEVAAAEEGGESADGAPAEADGGNG